jgi:epoxyqueuosine reductase
MPLYTNRNLSEDIIKKALSIGASLVGITSRHLILQSPSHKNSENVRWPSQAKSVVVIALKHKSTEPSLDWWDGIYGTPGNQKLISITIQLKRWFKKKYGILANDVPYYIHKGGIFLKDSGVYAGLGVIGKNNLIITPEYGPRVRLRALFVNVHLETTRFQKDFEPCKNCEIPCRQACPRKAFETGAYNRKLCQKQMEQDEIESTISKNTGIMYYEDAVIQYCRACELACPVSIENNREVDTV